MQRNPLSRSTWIDNLSGVLITYCVLFYHLPAFVGIGGATIRIVLRSLFSFFIAWFFFKSGMFYKNRTLKEEFNKCWRRLLIPFLTINAICILIRVFIFKDATPLEILKVDLYRESDVMCSPLWFCLSLSLVRLLYQDFSNKRIKILFIIASLVIAFLLHLYSYKLGDERIINLPPWIGNIFSGYFFYGLGDLLSNNQFNNYSFTISAILFGVFLFFPYSLDFYKNASDNYMLSIVYDLSGIILFNNIFKRCINTRTPLLTHLGANSMIYFITHYTFFYLSFSSPIVETPVWVNCLISFILTTLFLFIMDILFTKTRMRWLIGEG